MPRYFLRIAYDGTRYHGWQIQPGSPTVQQALNDALQKVLRQKQIETTGCGRTDTGVHASEFYLHFDLPVAVTDPEKELYRLNNCLPHDIAVKAFIPVHPEAHARFDATERSYEYRIHTRKDPFLLNYSAHLSYDLDVALMNEAGLWLLTQTDFAAFCKTGSDQHTTRCALIEAAWLKTGDQLKFTIRADRFLRNMVRAIVGTMVDLGRGRISLNDFHTIVESGNRSNAGTSAPACGLYLTGVKYPYLQSQSGEPL